MRRLFTLDQRDYDPAAPRLVRPSARGILIRGAKIALVHSLKYDYYKFPGGGLEPGERPEDALLREVREEAGLAVAPESVRPYGLVRRVQRGRMGETFQQDNYYYLCAPSGETPGQELDDYEAEEGFTLAWVEPETALEANRSSPKRQDLGGVMLERECRVLELLRREGYFQEAAPC